MRGVLVFLTAFALAACSQGTVMNVSNQSVCTIENVQGFRVASDGDSELVFALERVDPGMSRPVFFELDWRGTLLITADDPEGFSREFSVSPGLRNQDFVLNVDNPDDCRLRSSEAF